MSREDLARGLSNREIEGLRQEAWLGDAVLELYVRDRILKEEAAMNDARRISLVRNSFLNQIGQPTRVEAEIGRLYKAAGLDAAFAWIEQHVASQPAKNTGQPPRRKLPARAKRKRR